MFLLLLGNILLFLKDVHIITLRFTRKSYALCSFALLLELKLSLLYCDFKGGISITMNRL